MSRGGDLAEKRLFISFHFQLYQIINMTAEQLIEHVDKLRKEKNYKEIIPLLNDSILEELDNATLYAHRAEAHALLNEPDQAIFYANKSIKINSKLPLSYLSNGIAWNVKKEYNKAIDNLNKAIALDEKYVAAYNIRGNAFLLKKEYDKALDDYNKAIQLNNKYAFAYCNRGIVWNNKNEFDKAIDDSTNAIELDDKFANAYVNRGVAWVGKKEYDKAIDDYNKAISLDNKYNLTYHNRGVAWAAKKEYNKAIDDYDKAISLDDDYANTFFNRGIAYNELGNYVKAIKDYRKYIELTNAFDYRNQVAKSRIEDLQKKLNDIWYKDVSDVIDKIKNFLLFRDLHLTHYTSLSGAKSMILDKSEFRLSEGAYLNDTSEGQELFRYLNYSTVKQINDETVAEVFVERPFIGSFVIDSKHDDLTLWRTYGKEGGAEAKGCALTINKERFISTLKDRTIGVEDKSISVLQLENQFTFYKVVYIRKEEKNRFIIPG